MVLAGRGRRPVARHHVHKVVAPQQAQVVKQDRPETGDQADQHEIERPFAGMGDVLRHIFPGHGKQAL